MSASVVAPCLEIPTTDRLGPLGYSPTDYDLQFNGTSSATPCVAALAGLILSIKPALENSEVRQIISETTDKINAPAYVYLADGWQALRHVEQRGRLRSRINAELMELYSMSTRLDRQSRLAAGIRRSLAIGIDEPASGACAGDLSSS